jgi:P27 family predicted phage terminase small subunit
MKRGTKPQPTWKRKLAGNPGRRPLNEREPQLPVPSAAFDETPAELQRFPAAIAEWQRLAPMLRLGRHITEADRGALVAVCLEWARYLDAMAQVAKSGMVVLTPSGWPMTNPYLTIATRALSGCVRLWPELGLTPSSRTRVRTSDENERGVDPFAEFDEPVAPKPH